MDDFDAVRTARPSPAPATGEVTRRAKESLMNAIDQELAAGHPTSATVTSLAPRRRRRLGALVGAAAASAVLVLGVTLVAPGGGGHVTLSGTAPVAAVFSTAATIVADGEVAGSGPVRHRRFVNLSDEGRPTYDVYVRPDGTAMVGRAGGPLEESAGYLTTSQIDGLPEGTAELRDRMAALAVERGLARPGEAAERGIFRLATELLPDPGVSPEVKAGVYEVLAAFDLAAVRARNLGEGADPTGRPGLVAEFVFEEGVTERIVLDRSTGSLLSDQSLLPDGSTLGGQVYVAADLVEAIPTA